jgi:hypothetical protein
MSCDRCVWNNKYVGCLPQRKTTEYREEMDRILNKIDEPETLTREIFCYTYIDVLQVAEHLIKSCDKIELARDVIKLLSQYISMFTIDEVDSKRVFLQLTGVEKVDIAKIGDMFNPNWKDKNWKYEED